MTDTSDNIGNTGNDGYIKGNRVNSGNLGNSGTQGKDRYDLDMHEVSLNPVSVLRLCRKMFDGKEVIDLRLWQRAKDGKLFPRKGQGLCMRAQFWSEALKLFTDNQLPYIPENDGIENG